LTDLKARAKAHSRELTCSIGTHTQFFRKGSAEVLLLKIRSNATKFVDVPVWLAVLAGRISGASRSLEESMRVHQNARKAQ
jgi:hypothetical protein